MHMELSIDGMLAIARKATAVDSTVLIIDGLDGDWRHLALIVNPTDHAASRPLAYAVDEGRMIDPTETDLATLADAAEAQGIEWTP